MTHYGRDFSSYQGNLTAEDCAGIDFAYVKATEGSDYKNPYAPRQVAMLRSCGVAVGYYHFYDPSVPNRDQLDNFNKMAQALGPTPLPMATDSETQDPAGWQDLASRMVEFCQNVEAWTYPVPNPRSINYVNLTFYDNLPQFPWGRWVWLADPNPGAPHRPCLILQGAPRPVSSSDLKQVDPDTFMGTEDDWAQFVGQVGPAPAARPPVTSASPTTHAFGGSQVMRIDTSFTTDATGYACWDVVLPAGKTKDDVLNVMVDAGSPYDQQGTPPWHSASVDVDYQAVGDTTTNVARLVAKSDSPSHFFSARVWLTD